MYTFTLINSKCRIENIKFSLNKIIVYINMKFTIYYNREVIYRNSDYKTPIEDKIQMIICGDTIYSYGPSTNYHYFCFTKLLTFYVLSL